jgi:hypothetical protein
LRHIGSKIMPRILPTCQQETSVKRKTNGSKRTKRREKRFRLKGNPQKEENALEEKRSCVINKKSGARIRRIDNKPGAVQIQLS